MLEAQIDVVETALTRTAGIRRVVPATEIVAFFDTAYTAVLTAVTAQGAAIVGPGFARYFSAPTDTFDLEAGFPVDADIAADGDVAPGFLPAGRAARAVHLGSYDQLPSAWQQLDIWIDDHGLRRLGPMWEVYVTMPTPDVDPADLRTDLFVTID